MSIRIVTEEQDRALHAHLEGAVGPLDFAEAMFALGRPEVRRLLTEALAAAPFEAFFWECAPVTPSLGQRFEFVLVDSPTLARVRADPGPFADQLGGPSEIRTFPNLGGRSLLIAPGEFGADGAHLARFVRHGPAALVDALWQAVPPAVERWFAAGAERLWLSTSGLGVHWLHLRLDPRPKYYTWAPFRAPPSDRWR